MRKHRTLYTTISYIYKRRREKMTKKYCTFAGWSLFAACILVTGAERGYSDDLFKASLTGASSSYSLEKDKDDNDDYDENEDKAKISKDTDDDDDDNDENEVKAKISIKDNGKIELSIKGLKSLPDKKPVNQSSILVIETEINDTDKKEYSFPFDITDGSAKKDFTLEDLNKDDKLEILSVAVNKGTSTTPTPTVTASPTSSPTATPTVTVSPTPTGTSTATPTVTASPTPAVTPTGTGTSSVAAVAQIFNASTVTDDAILVPGGIISESTTGATPTPTVTASPTPGASPTSSPAVIEAEVSIKPETINLESKGKFKASIKLPSASDVSDIVTNTVVCEGAPAISGKVDSSGRFIATFNIQELDLGFEIKTQKGREDKKVKV